MSAMPQNLVVIHLSASAVSVLVACRSACKTKIEVMAVGIAKTNSFYQGKIAHRSELVAALKTAIKDAEEMANVRIETALLCFASPEMFSGNASGTVFMSDQSKAVSNENMADVLANAKQNFVPTEHHVVQFVPQMIWPNDSDEAVKSVVGMTGLSNFRASYHLMALPVLSVNHLYDLVKDVNIAADGTLLDVVAGANYALIDDERNLGVLFVDIGAKSTSFCIYNKDILIYSGCLAKGGDTITQSIVSTLSVAPSEAERIKRLHASLLIHEKDKQNFVDIQKDGTMGVVSQETLSGVVRAGFDEIFDEILIKLNKAQLFSGFYKAGVVLSGGSCQVKDIVPYLKQKYGTAVHLANAEKSHLIVASPRLESATKSKLESLLKQRQLQTALGAMLYCLSDENSYQERIHRGDEVQTFHLKIKKKINHYLLSHLKKWL